jgi:tetratricopeptide (TPR) repeat protein
MVRGEGSEFIVKIARDEESLVGVREGDALLANEYGAVRTTGNTASDAAPDRNPEPPHEADTSALFDWARPFPRRVFYASQTGLEEEAEQLRQRLSEAEGDVEARSRLGVVLRKQGRMGEALAECIRAVEEAPGNAMCHYRLGLILRVQDPQRALQHLRSAVELDARCAPAWTLIAAITRDDESLDWALQIQPDLVDALVLKAQRLRKAGATDEAIGFLEAAIDAEPSNPLPRHQLARLLTDDLGRLDEAELHCRQGLERDPMYAPLHARLGRISLARGKPADAAKEFQKALALPLGGSEPAWKQSFLSLLARAHAEMGDHERAENEFQAAVLIDPSFGPAQNEYALFLLEREKDLRTATQVAKAAAAFTPTNHSYRLTLGRAYFKLGCLDEALAQLEKARELYEGDPGVWYYLGVLYEARGDPDRARTAHNEALRILPSFSPSAEALRGLTDDMD